MDEAEIFVQGGRGGDGAISFRREKYVPRGGPDGGDGGRGGHVVLVADAGIRTLLAFRRRRRFIAQSGRPGEGRNKRGRDGQDLLLPVPVGTMVYDAAGKRLADLTQPGARVIAARGGRGGKGNARFKSPTNQAPRVAEKGEPGEERILRLELKLLADVGLVGLPNAGKSTLLAAVSAARPKTAPYPFTTLEPELGVVRHHEDDQTSVWADIPGLIEGAHQGKGLGHAFLRHIERTRVLVHVVDAAAVDGRDPVDAFYTVMRELGAFNPRLLTLPMLLAANKIDLPQAEKHLPALRALSEKERLPLHLISAATGAGIEALKAGVWNALAAVAEKEDVERERKEGEAPVFVYRYRERSDPRAFTVANVDGVFVVQGEVVERWVAMTDFDNEEGVRLLQRRLRRAGVEAALRRAGIADGDTVRIGDWEFQFVDERAID